MALSLAVKRGSEIDIGSSRIKIKEVVRGHSIQVEIGDKTYTVTDAQSTQIMPDVFLSYGLPSGKDHLAAVRLAIEAPRSIPIRRVGAH